MRITPHSLKLKNLNKNQKIFAVFVASVVLIVIAASVSIFNNINVLSASERNLNAQLSESAAKLKELESADQYQINKKLSEEIKNIEESYSKSSKTYETLIDLRDSKVNVTKEEKQWALVISYLAKRNHASASSELIALDTKLEGLKKTSASSAVPNLANVPVNNTAPGSGYSRQAVKSDAGDFLVDIVAADLGSTRVTVDSASDSDCRDNCPVLSLGDYVSRSGAYAGVNGSYFCPASYPSCAGKANSFDTLIMNKNKKYLNSDNNVYSTVPAAIFQGGSVRYVGQSLEWGRDTGVDGVIANQPLLLSGGNVIFGGSGDPKQGSKGSRSFVGSKGSTVYIGVVHNATVAEVARVLKALGLEGALNLDSGGSTALFVNGGYKAGPGRAIPNAVLFIRK